MMKMENNFYILIDFSSRVLAKLSRIASSLAHKWEPIDIQQRSVIQSTRYNMVTASDEPYYAEQYWHIIFQ